MDNDGHRFFLFNILNVFVYPIMYSRISFLVNAVACSFILNVDYSECLTIPNHEQLSTHCLTHESHANLKKSSSF